MIRFDSASPDYVRAVFASMWTHLSDDSSGTPEQYEPVDSPLVEYVVPTDREPMGVLMLVRVNAATVELHTALLPEHRGRTVEIFQALREHLKGRASWLRTWVPAFNRPAFHAAHKVGFSLIGTERQSYLKDGQLHDLHLFGVSL